MRRIVIAIFFACSVTNAAAISNAVNQNHLKSFNLMLGDNIVPKQIPSRTCCEQTDFSYDDQEPGAGDSADRLNVKPEFFYGKKDDDYNDRLDQYDKQLKLKVKVPVDIDFK